MFCMTEYNKVICTGIFEGLIGNLEVITITFGQLFEEESSDDADIFFVGVVGGTFIILGLLINFFHLFLAGWHFGSKCAIPS